MKISKFYTGVNNIILISVNVEDLYKPIEIDKERKLVKINGNWIDLSEYYDKHSSGIKILGLLSNMREKQFKPLVILDKIYKEKMNFAKKRFYSFLNEVEWPFDEQKTLVIRF